jgi:hypothetical protein
LIVLPKLLRRYRPGQDESCPLTWVALWSKHRDLQYSHWDVEAVAVAASDRSLCLDCQLHLHRQQCASPAVQRMHEVAKMKAAAKRFQTLAARMMDAAVLQAFLSQE